MFEQATQDALDFAFHARNLKPYARLEIDDPKIIAVDFDETISDNPTAWLSVMRILELAGYHVIVVTWRKPDSWPEDLQFLIDKGYAVFYTSLHAKDRFMKEQHGIDVSIWIDDNPFAILNDAENIKEGCIYQDGRRDDQQR